MTECTWAIMNEFWGSDFSNLCIGDLSRSFCFLLIYQQVLVFLEGPLQIQQCVPHWSSPLPPNPLIHPLPPPPPHFSIYCPQGQLPKTETSKSSLTLRLSPGQTPEPLVKVTAGMCLTPSSSNVTPVGLQVEQLADAPRRFRIS